MGFPDRLRFGRARLAVELLEDRTTPTKLNDLASLALPELVATGAVAGDRVNVVMTAEVNTAADAASLAAAPFASSVKALGFGIYSVTLAPGTDLGAAVAYYGSRPGVVGAAPDEIVQLQRTPNDPSYSSLYGMTRIGAPAAWDASTGGSFVVAVIDTGVDYNHPDLAANMWRNPGETADGLDNDSNGLIDDVFGADFANDDGNPLDDNNHGTHVAGTIGATGNNGVGVAGVNWSVKIMALKFLGANGSGAISNAVLCLDYAVTKGAKVSNNSWGGGGYSTTMATAIGRAQSFGHIFVAAAGNSGQNIDVTASYPASYIQSFTNVITVAATDSADALASFSNYGASAVTLAAPGVGILSTTRNNTYSSFSGTSMAAPHVAGAIALYWNANPTLTYTQVIDKLKSSVDAVSTLSGKVATGGRLNVAKMFASTSPPPAPGPKVLTATYGGTTTSLSSVRVTFSKAMNTGSFTTADVASFTGPNGAIAVSGVAPVAGSNTQFDITFAAQTTAGNYSLVFGPNVTDTTGKAMDQDGDGTAGEATQDRFTATGSLVLNVSRTFVAAGLPLAIRDNTTTISMIDVKEAVKITDLNVRVSATHTYTSDLFVTLTSPTVGTTVGKTVTLFNRRGGGGDNLTNTTFDDEAGTAIASGAAPFSGSFRADALLSAFDGLSTLGVWTLRVADRASQDVGNLTAWSLIVNGTVGSGSGGATALGFLDELVPADEAGDAFEYDAAPLEVARSEPARAGAPPMEVDYGSSVAPMAWLSPEDERHEYAPPTEASESRDESEFRPEAGDDRRERPAEVALAGLYLAPDDSDAPFAEEVA